MLRLRIQTAIVLITLLGLSFYFLPLNGLQLMFLAVLTLAAKEWAKLSLMDGESNQWMFALAVTIFTTYLQYNLSSSLMLIYLEIIVFFWFVFIIYCLFFIKKIVKSSAFSVSWLIAGVFILSSAWLAILSLLAYFDSNRILLFMLIAVVWVTDTGAYFVGKTIGKHKFSPIISPGKTWEGVAGGVVLAFIYGYFIAPNFNSNQLNFAGFILIAAWFSVFGDLLESVLKRQASQKDSGTILPGHGGILDRLDSMLAFAPIAVIGLRSL